MTIEEFWDIIERSKRAALQRNPQDQYKYQAAELRGLLAPLPRAEIVEFEIISCQLSAALYTYDLGAVCYLLNESASGDTFLDFRHWVISQGREIFEVACTDPDALVKYLQFPQDAREPESGFANAALRVLEERVATLNLPAEQGCWTDDELQRIPRCPGDLQGPKRWQEKKQLKALFPNLVDYARRRDRILLGDDFDEFPD